MIYLWLKALHLIAVILWLTGLAVTVSRRSTAAV